MKKIFLFAFFSTVGVLILFIAFELIKIDNASSIDKKPTRENQIAEIIKQANRYHEEGKTEEAIRLLKTALEENPGNFSLTLELAKSYEESGDIDLAISTYEEARKINPDHYLPCRQLGFLYLKEKKDTDKAIEMFKISLQLNENQPYVRQTLSILLGPDKADKSDKSDMTPEPPKPPSPQPPNPTAPTIPNPTPPNPRPQIPIPHPGNQ